MKAKPHKIVTIDERTQYVECEPHEAEYVFLNMPGPLSNRIIPVIPNMKDKRAGTGCWSWNGDTEKPTLKPSIASQAPRPLTEEEYDMMVNCGVEVHVEDVKCHTWVTDGMVKFLNDSTHELAGKTMPLNDVE